MKRIKCLSMVVLAFGLLMCFGQRTKAEVEAKKADIKAKKASNFEVRKATLGKKQIQNSDKKGMRVAKLDRDALKAKLKANSTAKRANVQNKSKIKSIEKKKFEPKQRKAFTNNKNK